MVSLMLKIYCDSGIKLGNTFHGIWHVPNSKGMNELSKIKTIKEVNTAYK